MGLEQIWDMSYRSTLILTFSLSFNFKDDPDDRDSKLAILKMFKFATYLDGRWVGLGEIEIKYKLGMSSAKLRSADMQPPTPQELEATTCIQLINQKKPT